MKVFQLPDEYQLLKKIDLQKDLKLAILVNVLSLVLAAVCAGIGALIKPPFIAVENADSLSSVLIGCAVVCLLMVAYIILHELVHGVFFKKYSGKKAEYGYTGLYAYAKSDAYYNKKEYIIIGLSPVVILGAVLLICNIALFETYFWVVYLIQIVNISGAAGDLYVTYILRKMSDDILVYDNGVSMEMYAKQ